MYTVFFCKHSDHSNCAKVDVVEPPSTSNLEAFRGTPNNLHRLLTEGDVNAVRSVHLKPLAEFIILFTVLIFIVILYLLLLLLLYSYFCREMLAKVASGNSDGSIHSLLEAQNADGQTALHLACRRGSAELVEVILEYREANVDVLDKDGDPPLVFALAAGSPDCVRALITRYANVGSRLREGLGPSVAHVCAYHGQPDCMRVGFILINDNLFIHLLL